jgi:myo-inositol 2-dehydrogenase/D-chiro-inositol 1-dehydrogenase
MRATSSLRIGVVGVGRIGAFHARTLTALSGVAALAVADIDRRRAKQLADELGARAATVDELFAGAVDALVVAAPTPAHAPLLRRAAEAGVPVFCEKPVALDLATLEAVREDVERAGIFVQIGFQRRFDAGYRAARDVVASGAIGTLLVLRAATHDPAPPSEGYIAASGGIFRDLHIHDFDAIRFVTGREIAEVYADGAVRVTPWFAQHGDVDTAAAVLRLEDGTLAIASGSRHDARGYDVRLEVFGTGESIVVGVGDRSPYRSVEPGAQAPDRGYRTFLDRFADAYRAELEAFVEAVTSGGPSPCTLDDARAALAAAVAADRSRAARRPVPVEEVALTRIG